MTGASGAPGESGPLYGAQQVTVESGFGYGVIGADLHVFADRGPVYLLHEYRPDPEPDSAWLLAQPSRMLNARYAIVGFTGRDQELAELAGWRDARESRLSARWLHAPGGQGKTRLANAFAHHSVNEKWKVITALHGMGSVLPPMGSQDLRLHDARGVLLIIDYADRWPASHLAWLFSNALLHQHVLARLLLIARTANPWPAIRAGLEAHQADTSDQVLAPLLDEPGGRHRMFTVARDAFASHYRIADPTVIRPPGVLGGADFGLTLAVHMAALAAVDAATSGVTAPADMAGLTAYLLDRERQHWTRLYENRAEGLEFATPPTVMARAVFTAALTGAVSHREGTTILTRLGIGGQMQRILADHAACYPSAYPADATVLEPLYPDRLAEDYLALALPGHDISGYPPDPWTDTAPVSLLVRTGDTSAPGYTPRAVTFLTAAAARWPHIGTRYLYPLLRRDPELALRGGSVVLTALADLSAAPVDLLTAIAARFPEQEHVDLDAGIAAVTRRLAADALTATRDPAGRAAIRHDLARRLFRAGHYQEALAAQQDALRDMRHLAVVDPVTHAPNLGRTLHNLANFLRQVGRYTEAVSAAEEAMEIFQRVASSLPAYEEDLAKAMGSLADCSRHARQPDEAVAELLRKSAGILRRLAVTDPHRHEPDLVAALAELGVCLRTTGKPAAAVNVFREAVQIARRLAAVDPAAHQNHLAKGLTSLSHALMEVGEYEEEIRIAEEAVMVNRRLAAANPAVYEYQLAASLNALGIALRQVSRRDEAVAPAEEAVEITRRLVAANLAAYELFLAITLDNLGTRQAEAAPGRPNEAALAATEEAVSILQRIAATDPARVEHDLARTLANLATRLAEAGRWHDALRIASEGIAIRRRLVLANSATYEPHLARELAILGNVTANACSRDKAKALIGESAGMLRRLAANNPAAFAPSLAQLLILLAWVSMDTPAGMQQARAAVAEATGILAPLAEQGHDLARMHLEAANQIRSFLGQPAGTQGCGTEAGATLSFRQAALGGTVRLRLTGVPRTVTARLPAGIHDGQQVRLRGQGMPAADGGPPGDLSVTIRVEPDKVFGRDRHNLTMRVPLTGSEAGLGSKIRIPLLDGRAVTLRIQQGTPDGKTFRVPSCGLCRADGTKGDLHVRVELTTDDVDAAAVRADLIAKAASAWQAHASQNPGLQ